MDVSMFGERERGEGKRERIREGGREGRAEWGREREKKTVTAIRDHWKAVESFFFLFKEKAIFAHV